MKKALFFIAPIALLLACNSKPKQTSASGTNTRPATQVSLLKKLMPIYQGVWVKTAYMDKIRQTKSVLASVDLVVGMVGIQIDSNLTNSGGWTYR